MAAWRYEIFLLVLKKYFTRSLPSFVKYFSTLEEKFRISARPCKILYVSSISITSLPTFMNPAIRPPPPPPQIKKLPHEHCFVKYIG